MGVTLPPPPAGIVDSLAQYLSAFIGIQLQRHGVIVRRMTYKATLHHTKEKYDVGKWPRYR